MEILQTIWTVLTSENETIINILSIPMTIIEITVSTLLFTSVLNIKSTSKQKILYILSFSLIAIISSKVIPAPYYTFINVLACPILVFLIFKTSILKSILSEVIPYITFMVFGLLMIVLLKLFTNMDSTIVNKIPILKIIYSLFLYLLTYISYIILSHKNIKISFMNELKKKNIHLLIINFLLGIIAIAMQVYVVSIYIDTLPNLITILNIIVLLIYFSISLYTLFRTNKLEVTTENLEKEKLYNKTITILYDNIRGFKHNFNNIVQALGGYIATDNMEGLKSYYNDLLNDSQKSNNLAVLNPELINNSAVYSILTSKYHETDKLGIKMNLEVVLDLKTLNIKTYDLTIILGILLDNAIEAAKNSKEKEINIIMHNDNKASRQLIIIENTYSNKDVDIDRIFEKGFTSKNNLDSQSHGLGLWNVRKILKKNNNLNLFTSKDKKFFKQQLEIYN